MNLIHFIWKFVRAQKFAFIAITLLSLIWTFEMIFWPLFLGKMINVLNQHDLSRHQALIILKVPMMCGAMLWVLMEIGFRIRDILQARTFSTFEAEMRMKLFDHIQRHSPKFFSEHFSGSIANKISDMVYTTVMMLRTVLTLFTPAFVSCLITILIFAKINPFLALIVGIWVLSHLGVCCVFTAKCAKYSNLHGKTRSALSGKIVDSLTNNFVVNLFFRFRYEKEYVAKYQKREKQANYLAQAYTTKMFAFLSVALTLEVCILTRFIIVYWTKGEITTAEVVQLFYTIWNLITIVMFVADTATEFFQSFGIAKQALATLEAPQDILDVPGAKPMQVKRGEIIFDHVSFYYGNKPIFKNKNLKIEAGQKVGLVGYSGAGKSTFVNLILRFFSIQSGRVLIDGQDLSKMTLESIRQQIALIPQDPILFHRSLEENIRYGKEGASKEEVIEAARQAHCDEFIRKRPMGYRTLVGERGTKLSGGEKQRIAIARAMLLKAPILILDEATSALDSITERYIQDSLEKLMENRTTIVVAHRLSTLAKMDRILVFDQGKIVEDGTHEELLNQNGHYAKLWEMQAGGFLPVGGS